MVGKDEKYQEFWKNLSSYCNEIKLTYADNRIWSFSPNTRITHFLEDVLEELIFIESMLCYIEKYGEKFSLNYIDSKELKKVYDRLNFSDITVEMQPVNITTNNDNSINYNGNYSPVNNAKNGNQNITYNNALTPEIIELIQINKQELQNNGFTEEEIDEICKGTTKDNIQNFMTKAITLGNVANGVTIAQGLASILTTSM